MKKLFDTNSFVKNYKMYSAFSGEVLEGKPFTYCPELEEYRYNIEMLFKVWEYFLKGFDIALVHTTIDLVIERIKQIGSIKINKELFNYILKNPSLHIEMWDMANLLAFIYAPKKDDNFKDFYSEGHKLFYIMKDEIRYKSSINSGNEFLNELFDYLFSKRDELENLSFEAERVITLIISYLHYHDIHDYKYLEMYLNNVSYYNDKFKVNYIKPGIDTVCISDNPEFVDCLSQLFNNLDTFFDDIKVVIK